MKATSIRAIRRVARSDGLRGDSGGRAGGSAGRDGHRLAADDHARFRHEGNQSLAIAWQATQLIEADLRQTAELMPLTPNRKDYYSYPEVTAPTFSKWRDKARRH